MISFEQLLLEVPECNDFRRLANGDWVAYSTAMDEQGRAIRAVGLTIREALEILKEELK